MHKSAGSERFDYLPQGLAPRPTAGYQASSDTTHGLSKQCIRVAHVTLQAFWTVLIFHILACSLEKVKSTVSFHQYHHSTKTDVLERPSQRANYSVHLRFTDELFHQAHFSIFINLVQKCFQSGHISVTSGTPGLCSLISILNLSSLRLLAFSPKSTFWQEHSAKKPFGRFWGAVPELLQITLSRT